MSRYVSRAEKLKRITLLSLAFGLLLGLSYSFFFRSLVEAVVLALAAAVYLFVALLFLMHTGHVHFSITLSRAALNRALPRALASGSYRLINLPITRTLFLVALGAVFVASLIIAAAGLPGRIYALASLVLLGLLYLFLRHRIEWHLLPSGLAFDYGRIVTLLRWPEMRTIELKDKLVRIRLKEKNIWRTLPVREPRKFAAILRVKLARAKTSPSALRASL